jgi:hypothetical protein
LSRALSRSNETILACDRLIVMVGLGIEGDHTSADALDLS